jgi:hypothetical protein
MFKTQTLRRCAALLLALALVAPAGAVAKANPWSFDFDESALCTNPGASYCASNLKKLSAGLPGLPSLTTSGIVELKTGQVQLYLYKDVVDALKRAKASSPPTLPTLKRTPKTCVKHAGFSLPALLGSGAPLVCKLAVQQAMAAFAAAKLKTCFHVEFPESYVYEHTPVGKVDFGTVSSLEKLISFAGEALTHVDYPTGLLPADFYSRSRKVIAKLRYTPLKQELADRVKAYQAGLATLQKNSSCINKATLAAFGTTVNGLVAELKAVEKDLDALYKAGLAQAAKDLKQVQAQGRMRATLPFPALSDRDRELLAFYIGGIYWRMRGAGLIAVPPDPGQGLLRRLLYVQYPYQLIAELAGGMADAKGVGFNIFVQESWGYAKWYDMGNWPPTNDKYADLIEMTNRGKIATTLAAPPLKQRGFDVKHLIAGGLQMGPCYYYIWEELPKFTLGPFLKWPYMQFFELPTATGEFCTGAALGLGLTKTLLGGKPCTPDCAGKACGAPNGCGGTCGSCPPLDLGPQSDVGGLVPDSQSGSGPDAAALSDGPGRQDGAWRQDGAPPPAPLTPGEDAGCSCSLGGNPAERERGGAAALLTLLALLALFVRRGRRISAGGAAPGPRAGR